MALSFLYRLVRRIPGVLRVHRMDAAAEGTEILVLRHQLAVLRRCVPSGSRRGERAVAAPCICSCIRTRLIKVASSR